MVSFIVFKGDKHSEDKYSANLLHRTLIRRFMECVLQLLETVPNRDIFEIGCGEGQIMGVLYQNGYRVSGVDYDRNVVDGAVRNFRKQLNADVDAHVGNVYEPDSLEKGCTIVCCEVLEHLEDPKRALEVISQTAQEYFLLSVPREPLWRALNFLRGKYMRDLGNSPGHINHWSKAQFVALCRQYGEVVAVRSPLPWTMVLMRRSRS